MCWQMFFTQWKGDRGNQMMDCKAWCIHCSFFFQIFKYYVLPEVTNYVLAAFGDTEESLESKWMSSGIAPMMNC